MARCAAVIAADEVDGPSERGRGDVRERMRQTPDDRPCAGDQVEALDEVAARGRAAAEMKRPFPITAPAASWNGCGTEPRSTSPCVAGSSE
jgi:hypothetical protein